MDYLPFPGGTQFIHFIRANYLERFFPQLMDVSQFSRRFRAVSQWIEPLRRSWVLQLLDGNETQFCVDTKPLSVVGVKRSERHSEFAGSADYGYRSACRLYYFGDKFTLLSTVNGLPIAFDLVPANTDERPGGCQRLNPLRRQKIFRRSMAGSGPTGDEKSCANAPTSKSNLHGF